ncbi:hypothetical protein GGR56DRAFT_661864 [Xylariaceae sp. FL0804]|nr:hypothetical protein GGR56DRAFT_661864 [Xylariaceae sp. FL0804]
MHRGVCPHGCRRHGHHQTMAASVVARGDFVVVVVVDVIVVAARRQVGAPRPSAGAQVQGHGTTARRARVVHQPYVLDPAAGQADAEGVSGRGRGRGRAGHDRDWDRIRGGLGEDSGSAAILWGCLGWLLVIWYQTALNSENRRHLR